jgi:hypothetical protein
VLLEFGVECDDEARDPDYGTRRFVTPTDSVAAARLNVAPEIFLAMMRTVLLD